MTSALQPLASASSSTVLPVPKPPGMAALPPCATGNRQSRMRWPVTSGALVGTRRATGRGTRTGQAWLIASSRRLAVAPSPWRSTHTGASSAYSPAATTDSTMPAASGGARQRCVRPVAELASPITAPGASSAPAAMPRREVEACRRRRCACPAARTPIRPPTTAAAGRRRCGRAAPGPSRMVSACPSPCTSVPGRRPVVSS